MDVPRPAADVVDAFEDCRPQITSPLQKEMCCRQARLLVFLVSPREPQGHEIFCDRQPQPAESSDRYFDHVKMLG